MPIILSPVTGGPASWHYANELAVQDIIGIDNLDEISQLDPDDINRDSDRIQRGGDWSDSYIDAKLSGCGFTVPLAHTDTRTDTLMKDVSARLVAFWLYNNRGVREADSDEQSRAVRAVGGLFQAHKKMADDILNGICDGTVLITADKDSNPTTNQAGGFSFVPINRGTAVTSDENARPGSGV